MARRRRPNDVAAAQGLRFGVWSVWRSDWECEPPDFDLLIVLPTRDWCVRVPVDHNGWIDFRVAPDDWYTCFSNGDVTPDGPDLEVPLASFLSREPASEWAVGDYSAAEWRFEVTADRLLIRHPNNAVPLVFWRDRPLWTREKKPLPGCEG
jgi:hypothetical protein